MVGKVGLSSQDGSHRMSEATSKVLSSRSLLDLARAQTRGIELCE
jgi:hypothetical protein